MRQVRRAEAVWSGDLASGTGRTSARTSGAFSDLGVSWRARTESADGSTSPEELLAAAHAACFSMALSSRLAKAGAPPEQLAVSAEVTFEKLDAGWKVTRSDLVVTARANGIEEPKLRELAEDAKVNCPISQALKGNVEMAVEASLEA